MMDDAARARWQNETLAARLMRESFLSEVCGHRYRAGSAVYMLLPMPIIELWEAGWDWIRAGPWSERRNRCRFVRVVVWRALRAPEYAL